MSQSHVNSCILLLMLLSPLVADAASVRRRGTSESADSEPWRQPCGIESDTHERVRRATRFRSYWQRVFDDLESMAGTMVDIVEEIITSYVSFITSYSSLSLTT